MTFDNLESFARYLEALPVAPSLNAALEEIGKRVEATAKAEMGTYQPAMGPYKAWQELADSTKADRVAKGFTENDPLLRTGQQRDAISHTVKPMPPGSIAFGSTGDVEIGSPEKILLWLEVGTARMPPRPVLGTALLYNMPAIKRIAGSAAANALLPTGMKVSIE